jgi:hypothetical protein
MFLSISQNNTRYRETQLALKLSRTLVTLSGIYSLRAIRKFIYELCSVPFFPLHGGKHAKFQVLSHRKCTVFKLLKTTDWFKSFRSSGMWCRVAGLGFPDVSKEHSNFISKCWGAKYCLALLTYSTSVFPKRLSSRNSFVFEKQPRIFKSLLT